MDQFILSIIKNIIHTFSDSKNIRLENPEIVKDLEAIYLKYNQNKESKAQTDSSQSKVLSKNTLSKNDVAAIKELQNSFSNPPPGSILDTIKQKVENDKDITAQNEALRQALRETEDKAEAERLLNSLKSMNSNTT